MRDEKMSKKKRDSLKKGSRIGKVMHISKSSGNLIIKSSRNAKIGETVTNSKGKRIGVIFDLFGPINDPYVSVKTKEKKSEKLIGKELFSGKRKK
jgi:rRNA processing protein Gar1